MIDTFQHLRNETARLYTQFVSSERAVIIATSALVGIGAGFGAIVFRWLIGFFKELAFGGGKAALSFLGPFYIVLIPVIGGLIVGPLVFFSLVRRKGMGYLR
ncbi:MAG: hypothetical protein ACE5I0_04785 [Candidatus Binatia bacterium]